jgi:2'-5' RNA ligase
MEHKKFLTVMAVLDDQTQTAMASIQSAIIANVGDGTQTMSIPFHITLGSYSTDELDAVLGKIKSVAVEHCELDVDILGYNSFGDSVLFLEPSIPDGLKALRREFECDYATGFDWVPHATLFCGASNEVKAAKELVKDIPYPEKARIVAIELGEFFPARKIITEQLIKQEDI